MSQVEGDLALPAYWQNGDLELKMWAMVLHCAHLNIVCLGHLVQQLQSLLLQHVIWVFEAVNDSQLMLSSILGVDAHNARQPINAHILQVVAAALQEGGNHFCRCKATAQ